MNRLSTGDFPQTFHALQVNVALFFHCVFEAAFNEPVRRGLTLHYDGTNQTGGTETTW